MISWKNVCREKSHLIAGVCLIWELIEIDDAHHTRSQYKSASVCQCWATYRIKSCRDAIPVNRSNLGEKDDSFSLIWVLLNNPEEMLFLFRSSLVLMGVLILSWRMDFVLDVSPEFVLGGGGGGGEYIWSKWAKVNIRYEFRAIKAAQIICSRRN